MVCKPELESELGHLASPRTVSDPNLSRQVRQMALHCNLASNIFSRAKLSPDDTYASNWLERLRHIKRLKAKVLKDLIEDEESSGAIHDFTSKIFVSSETALILFCLQIMCRSVSGRDVGDNLNMCDKNVIFLCYFYRQLLLILC